MRERTGLVLDPYFSGTKIEWLLTERDIPVDDDLAIGTIDAWLIWNLTGGTVFATDVTNASRTMLCDIRSRQWDRELCELLARADRLPSRDRSRRAGASASPASLDGVPAGIPISGVAGDQQAALFGQACVRAGDGEEHVRHRLVRPAQRRRDVPAARPRACSPPWRGRWPTAPTHYALEGSIFVTGSAIQWLRDGLELFDDAAEAGPLAASVDDSGGVFVVPAFTGLGSPWWDPYARGTIVGITRGVGRAHLTRAVVESMAFQTRDVVDAMVAASGTAITDLRVDGGASAMDLLCQIQADQLGVTVRRPIDRETTALGAAFLAGLAEGRVADDRRDRRPLGAGRRVHARTPTGRSPTCQHAQWLRAVERSRAWTT